MSVGPTSMFLMVTVSAIPPYEYRLPLVSLMVFCSESCSYFSVFGSSLSAIESSPPWLTIVPTRFIAMIVSTAMAMMIIGILDFLVRVVRLIGVCRLTSACCGV